MLHEQFSKAARLFERSPQQAVVAVDLEEAELILVKCTHQVNEGPETRHIELRIESEKRRVLVSVPVPQPDELAAELAFAWKWAKGEAPDERL